MLSPGEHVPGGEGGIGLHFIYQIGIIPEAVMIDDKVQIPGGSIVYPSLMNQPVVKLPFFAVYKPHDPVRPPSTMPDPTP